MQFTVTYQSRVIVDPHGPAVLDTGDFLRVFLQHEQQLTEEQ